jgi:hypothetical protein
VIRLFEKKVENRRDGFHFPVSMFAINLGTATCCAILTAVWFAMAFAIGEVDKPVPLGVTISLSLIPLAVAALGIAASATLRYLPWLAVCLTPLLCGLIMVLLRDRDAFSMGLRMGCVTSVVFVSGASVVRAFRFWVGARKPKSRM